MSFQSGLLHSLAGADNVKFFNRDGGGKNVRIGHCSSRYVVGQEKGEKEQLQQFFRVVSKDERLRQWTATNITPPHFRFKQARVVTSTWALNFAGHGLDEEAKTRSSSPNPKPFQQFACYKSNRRSPRRVVVECTSSEDKLTERKAWKDGPYGVVWEAEEIAQAVDGLVLMSASPGSISIDSRSINHGEWFLALVGPNFDGHQFVQQALDRGCVGFIGKVVDTDWPRGFIKVEDDTLLVLHRLAACVRRKYSGAVVGITGSTGKTTARVMTALALESLGTIHQSEGNFNNHIGLPLTLLKLPSTSSACVLEMGMNHAGEILALAKIARPSVRVLLNIGPAHFEHFGSLEDVAAAKAELLSEVRPGDVCILNADDPLVMNVAIPGGVQVVLFGRHDGCHLRIANAKATRGGRAVWVVLEQLQPSSTWVENSCSGHQLLEHLRENSLESKRNDSLVSASSTGMSYEASHESEFQQRMRSNSGFITLASDHDYVDIERCFPSAGLNLISKVEFEVPSPGLHLAVNACAAAAVAISLGVPLQTAGKSLSKYSPVGMRSRWEEVGIGGLQLINDTYNANPMSVESGLRLLHAMDCPGRRVAFLGDMLELGSVTKKAHLEALALCQELNLDIVGLVGPSFSEAAASQQPDKQKCVFVTFQSSTDLAAQVVDILRPGDVVLVKGSRGMKMEIAANAIKTVWAR